MLRVAGEKKTSPLGQRKDIMEGLTFYYSWEPLLMEWLQTRLGAFGAAAASFFTMFGEEMLMIVILGFLYWCYDKKAGQFIGTNIMAGILLNPMLKNIALRRRPYFDHPGIKCLRKVDASADAYDIAAQGYSFPSGHSANSAILYGSFPVVWKKRIFRILAVVLPLLVGLSRVALGVHYPTDVLAGWLLGIVIVIVLSALQRKVKNENVLHLILFLMVLPGIFYCRTDDYFTGLGMMAGFFLAIPFEKKYIRFRETRNPAAVILRLAGGIAVYFGSSTLLKMPFSKAFLSGGSMAALFVRSARYAIILFLMIGVYPLLFGRIIRENS